MEQLPKYLLLECLKWTLKSVAQMYYETHLYQERNIILMSGLGALLSTCAFDSKDRYSLHLSLEMVAAV